MARTLMSAPPTNRVTRSPKHPFQTVELPYTLQPIMFAPVMPGETLTNMYFESRVVSDPIKNPLIGWKKEYYFFYVKVTDLLDDAIRDMFIDPANTDLSATMGRASNSTPFYSAKGAVNYAVLALAKVWQHWFSDQDDVLSDYDVATATRQIGVPFVQIRDRFWLDSITDEDNMPLGADPGTATTMEQLDALDAAYRQLQSLGIANMTYEDWLRSQGIAIPNKDENKPERIAYFSDFQYPSNTINPSNGTPTSAVSYVFKNSVRDPKFFKEPGFIIGLSVSRPKVYFGNLAGNLAGFLSRAWDWSPNYLMEDNPSPMPWTALKKFAADTGPLGDYTAAGDGYWLDMRDLFLHGDQFQNVHAWDPAGTNTDGSFNMFALPPTDDHHKHRYPTEAMVKALFVDATDDAEGAFWVKQDGFVDLSIKGMQVDYTQGNIAQA